MPPPRSTLFPYTTLFRSVGRPYEGGVGGGGFPRVARVVIGPKGRSVRTTCRTYPRIGRIPFVGAAPVMRDHVHHAVAVQVAGRDRKSTRLNSSHGYISYAATEIYTLSLHDALPICWEAV